MSVGLKTAIVCTLSMIAVLIFTLSPFLATDYFSPFLLVVWFILANFIWACLLRQFFEYPRGTRRLDGDSSTGWQLYSFHIMWADRIVPNVLPEIFQPFFYKLRGAKIGKNVLLGGKIVEPELVEIGDDVVLGQGALISAHTILSNEGYFAPVIVERGATIGMHAVVFPGVHIMQNGIVGACSLVPKDTVIGENEIWAGTPARCVGRRNDDVASASAE